ncbi:MAG: serine aminopeptidase domain-containing protein [Phycisphaerales bacterium]
MTPHTTPTHAHRSSRNAIRRALFFLFFISSAITTARAEPIATTPPNPGPARHAITIETADTAPTRLDLALAFLRLEAIYRDNPRITDTLEPPDIRLANRLFDRATAEYFRGDITQVPALLTRAASIILNDTPDRARLRQTLSAITIPPQPPTDPAHPWPPRRLAAPPSTDLALIPPDAHLTLRDAGTSAPLHTHPIAPPAPPAPEHTNPAEPHTDPPRPIPTGSYIITIDAPAPDAALSIPIAHFEQPAPDRAAAHAALAARIEALAQHHPEALDPHSLASLRYRAALLDNTDWRPELTHLVIDLDQLQRDLQTEIEFVEALTSAADPEAPPSPAGFSPFRNRSGDHALAAHHHTGDLPLRFYAPPDPHPGNEPAAPRPLLIAFHGAGVDEHLWFQGYGGGRLRDLAQQHGFILVAPRAYTFMTDVTRLDALIDAVETWHDIDRSRIYILGHSMGGVLATAIAQARHSTIAAAVCIAGARWINTNAPIAPTRYYAPQLDPIVPPARVATPAAAAIDAGMPVQIIELPHQGHTLVVPAVLDDAVEWLLRQRNDPLPPAHRVP